MALITPVVARYDGTLVNYVAAAAGGDTILYTPNTEFRVKNGSGASITVTLVIPGNTEFGQATPDVAITIAAGAERAIALPKGAADSTNTISFTYSAVTSVTVAAVTCP